jgi:hypothetical protein
MSPGPTARVSSDRKRGTKQKPRRGNQDGSASALRVSRAAFGWDLAANTSPPPFDFVKREQHLAAILCHNYGRAGSAYTARYGRQAAIR